MRMNVMSNRPDVVAQCDASTARTAVQVRCWFRGGEKRVSWIAKAGLQACAMTGAVPHSTSRAGRVAIAQNGRRAKRFARMAGMFWDRALTRVMSHLRNG